MSIQATTKSKRSILDRLNTKTIQVPTLPDPAPEELVSFEDPLEQFTNVLGFVGGEAHLIERPEQATEILSKLDVFSSAKRIASTAPSAVEGNVDVSTIDDPHALSTLDWTVVRGEFLVAENGAIWVDGANLPHRVMIFIAQYLAIVVSRRQIVNHLHEAYARIGTPSAGFGVFVSGPSKTADIEQSLVLGAHGCRKLQVFLTP